MSLELALNNAISGLRINQKSIGVLSQNIANVNTPGYSRQVISQSAVVIEGVGSGVRLDEITRKIDAYLQRSVQAQSSNTSSTQAISDYYQRIQNLLGQPGSGNSVDATLTKFFNSVQSLAETPETTSLKSNAISSGVTIAKQLSDLAANMYDLRFQADNEIGNAVTDINGIIDRLDSLNIALSRATALGQPKTGLLDSRDAELRALAGHMNTAVTYSDTGAVTVAGGNGIVLVEEGVRHQLRYTQAQSVQTFVQDQSMGAIEVLTINQAGQSVGYPQQLISGGTSSTVKSGITGGTLDGLQQMRDVKLPAILEQLDSIASHLRDSMNAIHNNGSGYPPATTLTGERLVNSNDQFSWSGQVRIAVLQQDGTPVPSPYADESYTGVRPLTLDLAQLDSGQGAGKPTMQTIIDEINNHYGAPGNKAVLGNLNNIQLVSDTNFLPSGATSLFNFDLQLDNISSTVGKAFVTGITVANDLGVDITSVTQGAPSLTLQSTSSYITTVGSADVSINLMTPPTGLAVGDKIYLGAPGSAAVNGIAAADLTGFFTVTAISGNQVTFTAGAAAATSGAVNDASAVQMMPPYQAVGAGQNVRTSSQGQLQVDLTSGMASSYYDITVNVSVVGEDGVVHSAPVTYRVNNNQKDLYGERYDATTVGGAGTLVLPSNSQETMRAILVDANGNELPKVNGKYVDSSGYLKLIGGNTGATYSIAIDEMDSMQMGVPDGAPAQAGTNLGFSHYFGLNNFFASNAPTSTGDTLRNSALNMKVQDRFLNNANLLSIGNLTLQQKSAASGGRDVYTYARYSGDNSVAQQMAKLNTAIQSFDAAGGLPKTQLSLQAYTGEILGFISQRSAEATSNASTAQTIYDGFKSKSDAISGVNLDEELANTITFQNAYSATARIVTMVNKMYEDLLQMV